MHCLPPAETLTLMCTYPISFETSVHLNFTGQDPYKIESHRLVVTCSLLSSLLIL
jgi:hypothetical protein